MTDQPMRTGLVAILALALAACSGGGSDTTTPTPPTSTAPPPPVSQKGIEGVGVVARFGANFDSITVGDTTYAASAASVTIDDLPAVLSDLRVGNVVAVTAVTDDDGATATATAIRQINDLEGTIDAGSIDLANGTFGVLGQTVRVVATTVFDDDIVPPSLEGLAAGDAVEISVLDGGDGSYIATRVELDDDAGDFEITGVVSDLDDVLFVFNLGPLVVDYSQASLDGFDSGMISNGDRVEVEGSAIGAGGELIADEVSNESDDFDGDDGDFGEIEGLITLFVSATDFEVNGQPVTTTSGTQYEDGSAASLAAGVRVEVDGTLNADGVLVADEIDFEDGEDASDTEIAAVVDTVDTQAGTLGLLGLTVTVGADALLEDDSDAELEPFALADINPGDYVELTLIRRAFGLDVLVLERDDLDDEVRLEAQVDAVADPQLTVLGVPVETSAATQFEDDDTTISAGEFFGAVMQGDLLDVKGQWNGTAIVAEEVSFDDD